MRILESLKSAEFAVQVHTKTAKQLCRSGEKLTLAMSQFILEFGWASRAQRHQGRTFCAVAFRSDDSNTHLDETFTTLLANQAIKGNSWEPV